MRFLSKYFFTSILVDRITTCSGYAIGEMPCDCLIELLNIRECAADPNLAMEIAIRGKAHRINGHRLIVISFHVHTLQVDLKNLHVLFRNYIISKDAR